MAAKSIAAAASNEPEIRRIIVVCHGEPIDKVFGHQWLKFYDDDCNLKCSRAFSAANYVTFEDGNLPISLMDRAEGQKTYERDPPLTEVGKVGSLEVGYALGAVGVTAEKVGGFVYCSPTATCVESAHYLCKGLAIAAAGGQPVAKENDGFTLRLDSGLLPQIGHDPRLPGRVLPKWLTAEEIQTGLGRQVDAAYRSTAPETVSENVEDFYGRMRKTMDKLLQGVPSKKEQTLLIVGHPSSLEGCTRPMYGGALRRQRDFDAVTRQIPFCFSVRLSERTANTWQMSEPLAPGLTNSANDAYRWEAFGDANEMRKVLKK